MKTLQRTEGVAPISDIIDTRCEQCGLERRFEFDIGSFFNKHPLPLDLVKRAKQLDEHLYRQIIELLDLVQYDLPPMVRTVEYLRHLSETQDVLALDYIQEALRHFQTVAGENNG